MEPEGRAHGTTKEVEAGKRPLGNVDDDDFWVFPDFGVLPAAFRDLGAYGKESCKMSKNKVVHHKTHYRKLLTWFECLIGH
jgi:hypothetical protein